MPRLPHPRISAYGDHALHIQYDADGFSAAINDAVHSLASQLKTVSHWVDVMTGYDSLVVTFDSALLDMASAKRKVEDVLLHTQQLKTPHPEAHLIELPVHYGGEYGPDIKIISAATGLSETALIEMHAAQTYRVCMMGFIPGFAFLSEAPTALHHPRHDTPRARVPAGSIGIANWQTGIYGLESPGGWQIIGRTSTVLFDKTRDVPSRLQTGDQIRFIPQ